MRVPSEPPRQRPTLSYAVIDVTSRALPVMVRFTPTAMAPGRGRWFREQLGNGVRFNNIESNADRKLLAVFVGKMALFVLCPRTLLDVTDKNAERWKYNPPAFPTCSMPRSLRDVSLLANQVHIWPRVQPTMRGTHRSLQQLRSQSVERARICQPLFERYRHGLKPLS